MDGPQDETAIQESVLNAKILNLTDYLCTGRKRPCVEAAYQQK